MKKKPFKTIPLKNGRLAIIFLLPPESIINEVTSMDWNIGEIEKQRLENKTQDTFLLRPENGRALMGFVVNKNEFIRKSFEFADLVNPLNDIEVLK